MTTSSISKGCFVFKPRAKKRRDSNPEAYFINGNDDCKSAKERFWLCQELWDEIKSETESLQDDLNKQTLDSLLEFARKSASSFAYRGDWASRMRASEIPVAALVLGVNLTDHNMTLRSLSDRLQDSVSPFVVSLHAKECTALKSLLQKLLQRLAGVSVDDEEEEARTELPQKRALCSMRSLCDWYRSVSEISSPGKKRSSSEMKFSAHPPIIIIFRDLESFCPRVLRAFIHICSQYTQELPLLFIFGIATSLSAVQRMLPHSVTSLLSIELFQYSSCTKFLGTVIDKLVLTAEFPFKPNGKVLQVLVGLFLYHDFSVHNFIKGLQLSLLEHLCSRPLSVLCRRESEALARVQQLSRQEVEKIRQLPSFMRFVEEQQPQEQVRLLTSQERVKEVCQELLKGLHRYHQNYFPILRCLHTLTSSLPKYPLGKQIRELHVTCLEKNVWETEEYESTLQLLRILAKDELLSVLQSCVALLEPGETEELKEALTGLQDLRDRLQNLKACTDLAAVREQTDGDDEHVSEDGLQKKTDLFQLQKSLLQKESRRAKSRSPFELLRNETIEYMDSLVRRHLTKPESQPLYEVCYFTSSWALRYHLNATPRTSIQTALTRPHCYLQNEDLRSEAGAVSSSAPDICIVYKLHLECGRLINLYDWLEAYSTVVSAAEEENCDTSEKGKVEEIRRACFIRAVSELDFLGFIKSTQQKTDHVARLTWGGC